MAARRGAAHSPSAEVPLAVRWALNGEGDAGGIIGIYELRQVLHAEGLSSEGNKEELVERIRNNKEAWPKPLTRLSVITERSRRILSPSKRNRDCAATEAKSPMPPRRRPKSGATDEPPGDSQLARGSNAMSQPELQQAASSNIQQYPVVSSSIQ